MLEGEINLFPSRPDMRPSKWQEAFIKYVYPELDMDRSFMEGRLDRCHPLHFSNLFVQTVDLDNGLCLRRFSGITGRQEGKTLVLAYIAFKEVEQGKRVLYLGPTYDHLASAYTWIRRMCGKELADKIDFVSASIGPVARSRAFTGKKYDCVILDEVMFNINYDIHKYFEDTPLIVELGTPYHKFYTQFYSCLLD